MSSSPTGRAGVVVVDKPPGMTSHDVVDRIRKIFGTRKVGHGGTLDPDATGVLVVGVGAATRFLSYGGHRPKRYKATAIFGVVTSTQDASGEVVETHSVDLERHLVESAMKTFVGEIEQIPPMVSAVKVGGERLHRKARRGEDVERPSRRVSIHDFDLETLDRDRATLAVRCSSGTYVRTLVHDLGRKLGCGAHVASLRRIEASGFHESEAVALDDVTPDELRPLSEVVRGIRRLPLTDEEASLVAHGRSLPCRDHGVVEGEPVGMMRGDDLVAVYRRAGDSLVADRVVGS